MTRHINENYQQAISDDTKAIENNPDRAISSNDASKIQNSVPRDLGLAVLISAAGERPSNTMLESNPGWYAARFGFLKHVAFSGPINWLLGANLVSLPADFIETVSFGRISLSTGKQQTKEETETGQAIGATLNGGVNVQIDAFPFIWVSGLTFTGGLGYADRIGAGSGSVWGAGLTMGEVECLGNKWSLSVGATGYGDQK